MHLIVLSRFYFERKYRKILHVVYQIIHFARLFVVIVIEVETMRLQLLSNNRFVDRSEINACHIIHYSFNVVAVEDACQYAYIIDVEL